MPVHQNLGDDSPEFLLETAQRMTTSTRLSTRPKIQKSSPPWESVMRFCFAIMIVSLLAVPTVAQRPQNLSHRWQSLFNGKDLSGWGRNW